MRGVMPLARRLVSMRQVAWCCVAYVVLGSKVVDGIFCLYDDRQHVFPVHDFRRGYYIEDGARSDGQGVDFYAYAT